MWRALGASPAAHLAAWCLCACGRVSLPGQPQAGLELAPQADKKELPQGVQQLVQMGDRQRTAIAVGRTHTHKASPGAAPAPRRPSRSRDTLGQAAFSGPLYLSELPRELARTSAGGAAVTLPRPPDPGPAGPCFSPPACLPLGKPAGGCCHWALRPSDVFWRILFLHTRPVLSL